MTSFSSVDVLVADPSPELDALLQSMLGELELEANIRQVRGGQSVEQMVWVVTVAPFLVGIFEKFGESTGVRLGEIARRAGRRLFLREVRSGATVELDQTAQQDPEAMAALLALDLTTRPRDVVLVWQPTTKSWEPRA